MDPALLEYIRDAGGAYCDAAALEGVVPTGHRGVVNLAKMVGAVTERLARWGVGFLGAAAKYFAAYG